MTIRPIDFNGMIQRTYDVSLLKQQEDTKPLYDQQNIQMHVDKHQNEKIHTVQDANKSENTKNDADAKDEGRNKYFSNGRKKDTAKDKETVTAGRVVQKNRPGSFDIKI